MSSTGSMNLNVFGALGIAMHATGLFLHMTIWRKRPSAAKLLAIAGSFMVVAFFGGGGGGMGGGGDGFGGGGEYY